MNLQPVDFKTIAAKGAYVYCYLRKDGTPYYVGIASNSVRPFQPHTVGVPRKFPERIRVMRSGLSYEEAQQWEMRFIKRYGRKDLGNGILRNGTDGGEGNLNPSEETRYAIGSGKRGKELSSKTKQLLRQARSKQVFTEEEKKKRLVNHLAVVQSASYKANMSKRMKEICKTAEMKGKRSAAAKASWSDPEANKLRSKNISDSKMRKSAERAFAAYGISYENWASLTVWQRQKASIYFPVAQSLGLSLFDYMQLTRTEKLRAVARFKAAD